VKYSETRGEIRQKNNIPQIGPRSSSGNRNQQTWNKNRLDFSRNVFVVVRHRYVCNNSFASGWFNQLELLGQTCQAFQEIWVRALGIVRGIILRPGGTV
jgi:hypothetical protein